ncbi:hypothetical protein SAMN05444008_1252 [Cnuella takakiae]|uniref:Uncharacterized protein n=1 Tax=Cnuella takakiae TaxID=1302690 RepID=A0A1M5IPA7_9BACT|nr:hypothetical protein [Cnuella takakiae]OLY93942.1 hypothetical protein BUE76_20200 [Cnuella takakiae]SHG30142.1 hypothetical protein SAMN05444008_1252 [Cnuella takakiae]
MDQNTFKLIDGTFTPADAKEVLLSLISSKIQFNQMAAFSLQERQNADVTHHYQRVAELRTVKDAVLDIINLAAAEGYELNITGDFSISLVPGKNEVAEPAPARQLGQNPSEPEHYLA